MEGRDCFCHDRRFEVRVTIHSVVFYGHIDFAF